MATRFSVSLAHAGCDHTGFVVWEERDRADARGAGSPVMVGLPRGFVSLNGEDGSIEIVCAGCRQTVASAARADAADSGMPADPFVAETAAAAAATAAEPAAPREALGAVAAGDQHVAATEVAAVGAAAGEPAARGEAAPGAAAAGQDVAATSTVAVQTTSVEPSAPGPMEPAAPGSAEPTAPGSAAPVAPGKAPDTAAPAEHAGGETAATPPDTTAEDKVRADIEALFAEAEDVAPIRGDAIPPHLLDKLRHLADRMRQRRE